MTKTTPYSAEWVGPPDDKLARSLARTEGVQCHGIWVPWSDSKMLSRFGEFEGLPDFDVNKVAQCVTLSEDYATALDIGAHVGAVSVYLARKFARVFAFEAVPQTFEFLRQNTADLSNVSALNLAVGPMAGEVFFSHYPKHGQLSHVASQISEDRTFRIGPIPTRTIDSMKLDDVSFMKIDVEGYELPVLEGALKTLKRCRPLVMVEQGGNEEKYFGRPRNEASVFLEGLGMRLHPCSPAMTDDKLYTF